MKFPLLRLRNLQCEVRYLDNVENSDYVEIEVKKKDSDPHLIKRISLVPFVKTKNGPKYLSRNPYETLKYFEFPSSHLAYQDLPTLNNIVNVTAFYLSFKDFIYEIVNNAVLRILREEL